MGTESKVSGKDGNMKDEKTRRRMKEVVIDDWAFYTSCASRWSVRRSSIAILPSLLPFLLSPTYLWTLDDIYKLRIRVQNANMYMHMY